MDTAERGQNAKGGKEIADPTDAHDAGRGRHARKPSEVPAAGWLDILTRTKQQIAEDNLSIVAAGVAFYAFVAIVPALAVVIALYGWFADPTQIHAHITALARFLPADVLPLLTEQMARITSDNTSAGISAAVGLLVAMYSSANATKAVIEGLNIAYDETEKRSFIKLNLIAFALTIGAIIGVLVAVSLVAILPVVLKYLHITSALETFLNWIRWPLLILCFLSGLTVIYRYGPSRHNAKWKWVSWGAILATALWVLTCGLFSLYVSQLGSYEKTYGSLGAVVVFMLWLFITAFVILFGAELNSEMERQTLRDTTEGKEKPLGERGAEAADTVGPSRDEMKAKKAEAAARTARSIR